MKAGAQAHARRDEAGGGGQRDQTTEELLCGTLVCRTDSRGRLTEARYVRKGKTVGFVLRCQPEGQRGSWRPEHGQEQFMEDYGGGHLTLYSSWHDGAEAELPYQEWVDGHLADLRLRDLGFMRRRVEAAWNAKDWKSFCERTEAYFKGMLPFDRFDPELSCRFATALDRLGDRERARVFFSGAIEAWLGKAMADEALEGLTKMSACLGREAAETDLAEWLVGQVGGLPEAGKSRVERLAALSELARKLADFGGPAALEKVLGAHANPDPAVLEQRAFELGRSGREEEALALYRRLLQKEPGNPRVQNNVVALLAKLGRDAEAAQLLAGQGGDRKGAGPRERYGYHTNQACVLGRAGRFKEALPHARKAHRLEQQVNAGMACDTVCCGRKIHAAGLVSMGTANLLHVLNQLRRFEEAARVFDGVVGDRQMFQARVEGDREGAMRILIGGMCTALDQGSDASLERGLKLIPLCLELFPESRNADLEYNLACLYARSGKTRKALEALRDALEKGSSREHAARDPDLTRLHGLPEFTALLKG